VSGYELWLFVHISAAVVWIGGAIVFVMVVKPGT
jgi:uncharacterized membrane protein